LAFKKKIKSLKNNLSPMQENYHQALLKEYVLKEILEVFCKTIFSCFKA
jgi:hypothetical protein